MNQLAPKLILFILAPIALLIVLFLLVPILAHRADRTPDRCWKKDDIYYVNRADPALFVEKRVGIGYTLNFGNPWSWVVLTFITFVSIAPVILPFQYQRLHH
jgi:uncharacterized membrane protein